MQLPSESETKPFAQLLQLEGSHASQFKGHLSHELFFLLLKNPTAVQEHE
jgi:hypothetical protein